MRIRTGRAAAVCCLVFALLGGCRSAAPTAGDPEQFASDFAEVTASYQAGMDRVQEQGRTVAQTDPKQVAAVFDELRSVTIETRGQYEALQPPADLQEPVKSLVDNLRRQSEALERVAAGTRREAPEAEALQDLAGLLGEFAATQQLLAQRMAEDE